MIFDRTQLGSRARIPQLDLLRGVAVLAVIFNHYPCVRAFRFGWAGVDLFFVLSGFLISGLLFTDWKENRSISLSRFFIRRGFKIYPAFYFFLITTALVLMISPDFRQHAVSKYAAEVFFVQDYLPHIWPHTWSLAVEEQFYILFPLLLYLLSKLPLEVTERPFAAVPAISLLLLVVCLALRVARHPTSPDEVRLALHFRADALFAGVALGYLFHFQNAAFRVMAGWWLIPLSLLGLIPLCRYGESAAAAPYVLTSNALGFVCLVWWIIPRTRVRSPWIEQIGVHSYSIYLWHLFVKWWLLSLLPGLRSRFVLLALFVVASIVAGTSLGHLVEMRMLATREKYFPSKWVPGNPSYRLIGEHLKAVNHFGSAGTRPGAP